MVRSSGGNVQFKIANDTQITLAVQQLDGARRYHVLLRSHSDQGFEHWANGGLQVLVPEAVSRNRSDFEQRSRANNAR